MIIDNHFNKIIELAAGEKIKELCEPLKLLKINYFLYQRKMQNNRILFLTNNAQWQRYFYEQDLYQHDDFSYSQQKSGVYLWSSLEEKCIFSIAEEFGIQHGFTIVDNLKYYTEYWHFASSPDQNASVLNDCLNNIALIRRFMSYMKSNSADILKETNALMSNNFWVRKPIMKACAQKKSIDSWQQDEENFIKLTDTKRFCLIINGQDSYLTKKELICLNYLKNGLSANEIADVLNISKRTIETHLENIKEKTGCSKQFQLGYALAKTQLF